MKKQFVCTCINPIWDTDKLCEIIDNAKPISRQTFLKNCCVDELVKNYVKEYPQDFEFYKYKNIYFYRHSAIEYFYM